MAYETTTYQVLIASPSDTVEELKIIKQVLYDWNSLHMTEKGIVLLPVHWVSHVHPEMGGRPQGLIIKQMVKDCDILVGIFWSKFGSPTGVEESGTVEEIKEFMKEDKPVMIYFSKIPIDPDNINNEQIDKVKEFKKWCQDRGIYAEFDSHNDFKEKIYRHICQELRDYKNENVRPSKTKRERTIEILKKLEENLQINQATLPLAKGIIDECKQLWEITYPNIFPEGDTYLSQYRSIDSPTSSMSHKESEQWLSSALAFTSSIISLFTQFEDEEFEAKNYDIFKSTIHPPIPILIHLSKFDRMGNPDFFNRLYDLGKNIEWSSLNNSVISCTLTLKQILFESLMESTGNYTQSIDTLLDEVEFSKELMDELKLRSYLFDAKELKSAPPTITELNSATQLIFNIIEELEILSASKKGDD